MKEKSLWDWPFEHKAKFSTVSLAYGPLLEGILDIYLGKQEKIFHLNMEKEFYLFAGVSGYFLNYWWLGLLNRIQRPRLLNTAKAFAGALTEIIGDFGASPELARTGARMFSSVTSFPYRAIDLRLEGEYYLRSGKMGEAMDLYSGYLDERRKSEKEMYKTVVDPLGMLFIKGRAIVNDSKENLLKLGIMQLWNDDEKGYTYTWNKILETYESLELKVMHAMFLSIAEKEEKAEEAWKEVESHPQLKSEKRLTESRNEVYELQGEYFKNIVIVKKGNELKQEWKILKVIRSQLGSEIISITPLTWYKEGKREVLIVKRNKGKDLETLCNGNVSLEEKEKEAKKALENLATLHNTKIDKVENYSPVREFDRRFLSRFGYNREAELLFQSYQWFHERRTKGQTLVTSHGDFFPSNVLENGILIDLEKICCANPWFDLLTFLEAQQWQDTQREEILQEYTRKRNLDSLGRNFYKVHVGLCQTGSFIDKNPKISRYFEEKVKKELWELQEDGLRERLKVYLNVQS